MQLLIRLMTNEEVSRYSLNTMAVCGGLLFVLISYVGFVGWRNGTKRALQVYLGPTGKQFKKLLLEKFDNNAYLTASQMLDTYNRIAPVQLNTLNEVREAIFTPRIAGTNEVHRQKAVNYMNELMNNLNNRYVYQNCAFKGLSEVDAIGKFGEARLRNDEVLYASYNRAYMYHTFKYVSSTSYSGRRYSFNKGNSRIVWGTMSRRNNYSERMILVAVGNLYVTNRRIIFNGLGVETKQELYQSVPITNMNEIKLEGKRVKIDRAVGDDPSFGFLRRFEFNGIREKQKYVLKLVARIIDGTVEQGEPAVGFNPFEKEMTLIPAPAKIKNEPSWTA